MGTKKLESTSTKSDFANTNSTTTTTMNSMILSSRKAVVARPANSRRNARVAAVRNGSRVNMAGMQVLRPEKKYECLSYLPPLSDGRYWTMWKLPMFGCSDPQQVLNEIEECQKEYPGCRVRVVGFDRVRQVQMAGFIARK